MDKLKYLLFSGYPHRVIKTDILKAGFKYVRAFVFLQLPTFRGTCLPGFGVPARVPWLGIRLRSSFG